jgi:hypothetical protein
VALIEKKLEKRVPADKPRLSVVAPSGRRISARESSMDPITKTSHVRMIRSLAHMYKLQVLVDQSTLRCGTSCIEDLPDDELIGLHNTLRKAIDSARCGVPLHETDLISTDPMEAWG